MTLGVTARRRFRSMDGIAQGLHLHQHSGSATIRAIVHGTMSIMGEITRIPRLQLNQTRFHGSSRYTLFGYRAKHLGKEANHPKPHNALPNS